MLYRMFRRYGKRMQQHNINYFSLEHRCNKMTSALKVGFHLSEFGRAGSTARATKSNDLEIELNIQNKFCFVDFALNRIYFFV